MGKAGSAMAAGAALALAGCASAGGEPPARASDGADGPCRADGLDRFVGQKASAETGAALMKASGARTLRWGAPDSAMTMDFRPDRLTVSYDADMIITAARCG